MQIQFKKLIVYNSYDSNSIHKSNQFIEASSPNITSVQLFTP